MGTADLAFLGQDKGHIYECIGDKNQKYRQDQLTTPLQVRQTEYGYNAGCDLHESEHVTVGGIIGNQQRTAQQKIQSRTATDQDVYDNDEKQYRYRKHIDTLMISQTTEHNGG